MSPVSSSVRWERIFLVLTEMKGFLPGPLETGQPGRTGGARNIILHFTNSWPASDGSDQGAPHPTQPRLDHLLPGGFSPWSSGPVM